MKLDNCYVNLKQEMLFVKKKGKVKKKKETNRCQQRPCNKTLGQNYNRICYIHDKSLLFFILFSQKILRSYL